MTLTNPNIRSVTAFAPATCANVAVGFDILGFAFDNIGDEVTLTRRSDNQIVIETIESAETLPLAVEKNTASIVIQKLCHDLKLTEGFSLKIKKGIPLSSGMSGSAASSVAALVAFNAFLNSALTKPQLIEYALVGESLASGQAHADNVAPCLFGGLLLIQSIQPFEIVQLPIPNLYCALVHPHLQIATKQARQILTAEVPLQHYIKQSANLAGFIASLYTNDFDLLKKSLIDVLIEPQRAHWVPGFYEIKHAALAAGALGVSFSGSGPSMFAFAENEEAANNICSAMVKSFALQDIAADYWVSPISQIAAHVVDQIEG